ncbi:sensor domain-containing diguanylate cyclase [Aliikangiella marina]|uniref:diguanylate cyclase n=1 Tax=Aliikangiella marina TaxID=1712262 RepID=A0A545TDC5_9GAMM|nr:DUF484 family protein [Aliikangiella marina]TQV75223.1 sensor domain-containing diguanylate cyclase [Aliikangiella marina]
MDKAGKTKNSTEPAESENWVSASQHLSLIEKNKRLQNTLSQLIDSANKNQQTQDKFYQLELFFLESQTFESLMNRVLFDLKHKLSLSQVELVIIDPDKEIRRLLDEIYGELDYQDLRYVDDESEVASIYQSKVETRLTHSDEFIQRLFAGQPSLSKSAAVLPLWRGTKLIGSLHMGSPDPSRFHHQLATNFLQHMSSIISVCIENSISQERFVHLSLVDMLTRAKNRRFFFQALAKEIARATRANFPVSCLFIDIDYFKKINDLHGHSIGDRALRAVADAINNLLRKSDTLARFGGEEFTVLLPNSDATQANEIAERIRQTVARLQVIGSDKQPLKITISLGVSSWQPDPQKAANAEDIQNHLINAADKAVYEAKEAGRNCVKVSQSRL